MRIENEFKPLKICIDQEKDFKKLLRILSFVLSFEAHPQNSDRMCLQAISDAKEFYELLEGRE